MVGPEWLIVGGLVVLLFGAKKVPEVFAGLGKGIKEFKKAQLEEDEELGLDKAEIGVTAYSIRDE